MTISNPDIVRVIKARLEDCRCHGLPLDPQGFKPCGGCEHDARCLAEIVRVRCERDEARRLACKGLALETYHAAQFIGGQCALTADEIALERGWDCFKETP
jgi:hypothetical protein